MNGVLLSAVGGDISGTIGTMFDGFEAQLWLVAPIGLGIAAVIWGVPKALAFAKRVAK
jgi:hypothetical protein